MNLLEQHKFLLTMQLTSLMSSQQSELIRSPYKLFTYQSKSFMIEISLIKQDTMWFETYYANSENIKCDVKKHKVFGKQISFISDEIFMRLTNDEIEGADNICLRKCSRCKVIKKQEVTEDNNKPIRKRSEPRLMIDVVKPKPVNEAERRQAKLERQLFKDPKMWNFSA